MEAKAVGNEGKIYRLLPLTNTTITEIKSFRFRKKSLIHLKIDQENRESKTQASQRRIHSALAGGIS